MELKISPWREPGVLMIYEMFDICSERSTEMTFFDASFCSEVTLNFMSIYLRIQSDENVPIPESYNLTIETGSLPHSFFKYIG